ncbi:hypothetical protein GGS20DRAFT_414433 [Poronia punctata]|nr:hypothetical protein GGS20DRAFT_414433 [Poronia punctata]
MPPTISRTSAEPTLYEILSLSPKHLEGQAPSAQQKSIKHAYHKALLKYHPDKNPGNSPPSSPSPSQSQSQTNSSPSPSKSKSKSKSKSNPTPVKKPSSQITYTIDQIQQAYTVLSDSKQRREYDRHLLLTAQSHSSHSLHTQASEAQFHAVGVETVDLDDLAFDERTGVYHAPCRCGNERAYQFTDAELEEYEDDLVLMVQCLDCSLWLRVLFDAAEDEDEDDYPPPPANPNYSASTNPNLRQGADFTHGSGIRGGNLSASAPNQPLARQRSGGLATERRGSHNGSRSGKGWRFNFSFNWGLSLSGSASTATANTSLNSRD